MQLGYVQPLKLSRFLEKWETPDRKKPVEWWYLGTGPYYHYFAERWGKDHRVSWKIDKSETALTGVSQFRPQGGADRIVGILLTEEIVGAM
jgi:hypothetical protein